jgi:predicted MFS family arabinose efflux permease
MEPARLGRDYRRLWRAGAVSNLGDGVYLGALPLLAATLSRDPVDISLVVAASWLPWLLVGAVSGALADRSNRLRLMLGVDVGRFAVLVLLSAALAAGWATIGLLIVGALLLGVAQTLFDSAGQAVLPTIVGLDPARLSRANSQTAAAQTIGKELAGPPAGSALFGVIPILPFLLDAMSFLASALMLGRIRRTRGSPEPDGRPSVGADIVEGLRWLSSNRVVLMMAVVVGLSNLAWVGADSVLVLVAQDRLGMSGVWFGVLLAAPAIGAVPGTVLAGPVLRRVPVGIIFLVGLLLQAVVLLGIGLTSSPYLVVGLLAAGGLLSTVWNVAQVVQRQFLVPNRYMGRVVASMRIIAFGTAPLGAVAGGLAASRWGLPAPFHLAAIILTVATAAAAPYLNSRSIQRARAAASAPAPD